MGKEAHTNTYADMLRLPIVLDSIVRWGPRFSAHIINKNKLEPRKYTYNLLKGKAGLLRVKRGLEEGGGRGESVAVIIWVDRRWFYFFF